MQRVLLHCNTMRSPGGAFQADAGMVLKTRDEAHVRDAIRNNGGGTLDHFTLTAGNRFTGHAGQLIVVQDTGVPDGKHWLIEGDTTGSGYADYLVHPTSIDFH